MVYFQMWRYPAVGEAQGMKPQNVDYEMEHPAEQDTAAPWREKLYTAWESPYKQVNTTYETKL